MNREIIQKQGLKKLNARTQKWRVMLADGLFKDPTLLKSRLMKGIPGGMRMSVWPQLIKLKQFISKSPYVYQKLINSFSNNIYEISLDIPRTFPEEEDSKYLLGSLNNVLKAISIVHPQVGYCQGMNFLGIRLLQILNDQNAFWVLHYLFQNDLNIKNHFSDPKTVQKENYIFEELSKEKIPNIHRHITELHIVSQAYTIKWFMTLYSGCLKQQLFNRIFQIYLLEGWAIMHAVGLALLKNKQKQILKNTYEENLFLLGSGIYKIQEIQPFMNIVFSMDVNKNTIQDLEKKYQQTNLDKTSQIQRNNKRIQQLASRQDSNKIYKFQVPQVQSFSTLTFQNSLQQLNLESFSHLKILK